MLTEIKKKQILNKNSGFIVYISGTYLQPAGQIWPACCGTKNI